LERPLICSVWACIPRGGAFDFSLVTDGHMGPIWSWIAVIVKKFCRGLAFLNCRSLLFVAEDASKEVTCIKPNFAARCNLMFQVAVTVVSE
jgi:hypothetical protein